MSLVGHNDVANFFVKKRLFKYANDKPLYSILKKVGNLLDKGVKLGNRTS